MIIGCRKYFVVRLEIQTLSCVFDGLYKTHRLRDFRTNKATNVVDIKRK